MPNPRTVLCVTAAVALKPEGGGVQRCTREYVAVLRAAGLTVHFAAYPFEHRLGVRLLRRLRPRPYRDAVPRGFAATIRAAARTHDAGWVLLNQSEAAPLAEELGDLRAAGVRIGLLSHGTDSSDFLHVARIRASLNGGPAISGRDERWLGRTLFAEQRHHRHADLAFCLSETERLQAEWLGVPRAVLLPRVIGHQPLPWQPVAGRVGTVATLTHEPNYEGIALLAAELGRRPPPAVRLRLVGTPARLGQELAHRYPVIDYLGGLSDADLAREAGTWCAFVNPMFCHPRGCSTKLALPLEWELPVATSRAGARGYVWDETLVPLPATPAALADLVQQLCDPAEAARQRPAVATLARRSPQLDDVAGLVRTALA